MQVESPKPDAKQSLNWSVILKLWPYLWRFRYRISFAIGLLVIAKLANVAVPVSLKYIIDSLEPTLGVAAGQVVVIPMLWLLAYGLLRFSSVLFSELRDAIFWPVSERILTLLGSSVLSHLHRLDMEFHLSRKTGGLSRDIERGTRGVSFLLRSVVFSVIPIFVEVALVVGLFVWRFDTVFVSITVAAITLYIVYSVIVTTWRTRYVRLANRKDSEANTVAIESLLNFETVKYFNNESFEEQRYQEHLRQREQAKIKNHFSLAILNSGQALIIALAITAMMIYAAYQVAAGAITLGDLTMINALMIQVFIPLNALGFVYRELNRALADVESVFELLAVKPQIVDSPGCKELSRDTDGIRFDNVSFGYQPDRPILKAVSFQVLPGKKVAIVGHSGAGKSTIARLLFRFYDCDQGRIAMGDQDIRQIRLESLRAAIGVVPQDTVLFNDTIRENIRYGRPQATDQEVEQVCAHALLEAFVAQLPQGLDTVVGERGLKVSGGEKQRIALARTLLKQPRIFLFDEATSSLDSQTELYINQSLQQVAEAHTTLMIAHRLSTVVHCDEILVLDQGQIVERGNHLSLLAKDGHYARLWRVQHHKI